MKCKKLMISNQCCVSKMKTNSAPLVYPTLITSVVFIFVIFSGESGEHWALCFSPLGLGAFCLSYAFIMHTGNVMNILMMLYGFMMDVH